MHLPSASQGRKLAAGCAIFLGCSSVALAQTAPVTGSLVTLADSSQGSFNRLERLSAIANQDTYNRLTISRSGYVAPCTEDQQAPTASCPASLFRVLRNVRELVQTANELLGGGAGRPTQYSLGLDTEGLGFALRWTAAEELSALGSVSSEFATTQLASVMSRITALRFGATGFSVAGVATSPGSSGLLAQARPARGGGASADEEDIASSWGGFLNGSFGWGERQPTELGDAFSLDGKDLVLGIDYRFNHQFVLGVMAGYMRQRIDFDSTQSVVDGGIESDGVSATIYALQEWDGPYLSLSAAWKSQSIDSTRVINYPSFNINTQSTYATAYGSTTDTTLSASLSFGWPLAAGAFAAEPYLRGNYSLDNIDAFRERSVDQLNGNQPAGFDFAFEKQTIKSLDTAVGLRLQYVFTPSFGVLVPYVIGEVHRDFGRDIDATSATYNAGGDASGQFELPGDAVDEDFFTVAAGASMVLPHGVMGFVQVRAVEGLDYVTNRSITVGIRAEF